MFPCRLLIGSTPFSFLFLSRRAKQCSMCHPGNLTPGRGVPGKGALAAPVTLSVALQAAISPRR